MKMKKKWTQFTKEQLITMAQQSFSYSEWIRKMGYKDNGGNITRVPNEILQQYPDIDISHFTGQGWNKKLIFSDAALVEAPTIKRSTLLNQLIEIRGHRCEQCGNTEWLNQPIPLEVHHIDGDNQNNSLDNLQLLCPNCHALTENYRGRNINHKNQTEISEEEFVQALQNHKNIRQALLALNLSAKGGNYARANELIYKYQITHLMK